MASITISLSTIIGTAIGFVIGFVVRGFFQKSDSKRAERFLFGVVLLSVWIYNNFYLQLDNFWLNIAVAIVLTHFFDLKDLQKKIVGVVGK